MAFKTYDDDLVNVNISNKTHILEVGGGNFSSTNILQTLELCMVWSSLPPRTPGCKIPVSHGGWLVKRGPGSLWAVYVCKLAFGYIKVRVYMLLAGQGATILSL